MPKNTTSKSGFSGKIKSFSIVFTLLLLFVGVPLGFLYYQSEKSGISIAEVIRRKTGGANGDIIDVDSATSVGSDGSEMFKSMPIGFEFKEPPQLSNLAVVDLDGDKLEDVIVCDTKSNTISWVRQYPQGTFTESVLAEGLIAPAHVEAADFDKDGDQDLMLAVLGMLFPNNDKIGSVVILENNGDCTFKKHVVIEKVARVSDVRTGDLDGDGDNDLAVVQFGYDDGETRWIENLGNWKFESHILQSISGPVNIQIADADKDGDLDLFSIVSQEWEEIYCFENDGKGNFQPKLVWGSNNEDFGSSGISMADINQDGLPDILYTNGDAFDYVPPVPRPWHGVQWLENKGNLTFEFHRICNFPGAFSARPADVDQDGDTDILVVSGFNRWDEEGAESAIWLENDGKSNFVKHKVAEKPTHLITMEVGDFNNDGKPDMVTGGMHVYPPFDKMGRVTLWMNSAE